MVYCPVHKTKHKGKKRKALCEEAIRCKVYGYVAFKEWYSSKRGY